MEEEKKENQTTPPAKAQPIESKNHDKIEDLTTLHERAIATLSYFGPLAIVPFYLKKDSKFCRFHGKQGMILVIIFFLAKLMMVVDLVMDLALVLQIVIALWMGFIALSGRWQKMPLIYKWSCQLEKALSLKTKEEEVNDLAFKPDQIKPESEPNDKV